MIFFNYFNSPLSQNLFYKRISIQDLLNDKAPSGLDEEGEENWLHKKE
jgi:hypothetical protein